MAAANRTRSRVCGSRLSCFAINPTSLEGRTRTGSPPASVMKTRSAGHGPEDSARAIPSVAKDRGREIPYGPMPPSLRAVCAVVVLAGVWAPPCARAQASPYVPLDDPRLPLLEHLIARGDIADPSPMVRPFRRADALRVLVAAATAAESARGPAAIVHALRATFEALPGDQTWRVAARAGAQAYSHIRRDVLHPLGPDGVRPYADL